MVVGEGKSPDKTGIPQEIVGVGDGRWSGGRLEENGVGVRG
jgi:hypothetical protein